MRKFYSFKAGDNVPSWIVKITHDSRKGYFLSKGMKCVFLVSCIVIRESNKINAIMPVKNTTGESGCLIHIKNVNCSTISLCGGYAMAPNGVTFRQHYPDGYPEKQKITKQEAPR